MSLHPLVKCLVTGATGFVGRELCRRILEQGDSLHAASRGGDTLPGGVATFPHDLAIGALPPSCFEAVDAVFHLAGVAHRHAAAAEHEAVNHNAVLAMARRAAESGVRSFVYLSSVKAMGPAPDAHVRSEEETVLPRDAYGLAKWRAEEDLRATYAVGSMAVTILRPALVYGPGAGGNLARLARAVARGLPRPPERGGRSMISRGDLAALMLAAARPSPAGVRTWIAADGEVYSTRRIYDALRAARGRGLGHAWCPAWGWRVAAEFADWLRPGDESTWQQLFGTELYSNAAACRESGWRPAQRLEDVLAGAGGECG